MILAALTVVLEVFYAANFNSPRDPVSTSIMFCIKLSPAAEPKMGEFNL